MKARPGEWWMTRFVAMMDAHRFGEGAAKP